jgi:hypothetical protein
MRPWGEAVEWSKVRGPRDAAFRVPAYIKIV